jgi:signal peptidase I
MTFIRWFISSDVRNAVAMRKHVHRILSAQRDILAPPAIENVRLALSDLTGALDAGAKGEALKKETGKLEEAANKWFKPYPHAAWRENVEVLLVALAVAMAIRTFFLQPFKIPTGSMQPTLFGVNSEPDFSRSVSEVDYINRTGLTLNDPEQARLRAEAARLENIQKNMIIPTGWSRVKAWLHGDSYLHFVAPTDGKIETIFPPQKFLIFDLWQSFVFAGVKHTIWFPPDLGESDLYHRAGLFPGRTYHQGDDVIKMRASAGDHLFVDRLTYNFRKPERGEIIVFETAGIPEEMRDRYHIPADEFYIKRLVALPDEKVQIGNDRHLRINGQRLDASTPHFENVYGFNPSTPPRESQYSGHVNGTVSQKYNLSLGVPPLFPDEETVYEVPANSFMPMGDNTCNSLDSRFFGALSENYAIGKSFFVYWPITERFGLGNR